MTLTGVEGGRQASLKGPGTLLMLDVQAVLPHRPAQYITRGHRLYAAHRGASLLPLVGTGILNLRILQCLVVLIKYNFCSCHWLSG